MATAARPKRPSILKRIIGAIKPNASSKPIAPPSPFDPWDYDRTAEAIEDAFEAQTIDVSRRNTSTFQPSPGMASFQNRLIYVNPIYVNRAFFQGDHWQNGAGWIGPHPATGDAGFQEGMLEIINIFTSKNAIREVTVRHTDGTVGKPINWHLTPIRDLDPDEKPNADEAAKIKEATAIVRRWLETRKVLDTLRDAVTTLLLSERAALRLSIPAGLATLGEDGRLTISAASIEDALRVIYLEHPLPENAVVIRDDDTKLEAGLWQFEVAGDDEESDAATDAERDDRGYAALCFVDDQGLTVTRIFAEGADKPETESSLDMGRRLPMFEMRRAVLITVQGQQTQRALNLATTMLPRTAVTSGFMERLMIDAQLPGSPELDADGNRTGRWIEAPFYVGAGTTNFVQSSEYLDEEGKVKRANASVNYREPIAPDGPIKGADTHYRALLDDVGQLHVVMSGDATASGLSRINARIEYLSTLQRTGTQAEDAFRAVVDAALAMAEALSNQPGHYTDTIRCQASCRLDTGALSPVERTAIEASIGKTLSRETAMTLVGIDDVEAEKARMAADPLSRAILGGEVGKALTALTTPGATLEGAAKFMGIEPDLVKDLLTAPIVTPELAPIEKSPPVPGDPNAPPAPGKPGVPPQDTVPPTPAAK